MPKGGVMPGAGRPLGSKSKTNLMRIKMQERWVETVYARADEIFQTYAELAFGIKVAERTPTGEIKVYTTKPDRQALEWIMEHVWGKAPIKIDMDVTDKTAVVQTLLNILAKKQIYGESSDDIARLVEDSVGQPERLFIQPEDDKQKDVPTAESAS